VLMCEQMIAALEALDLESYMEESLRLQTVVHWDLHRGNIIFTPKESLFIDLDGASISFQVCDLHQVISELFDKMALRPERLQRMLEVYFEIFPHARNYKQIYFTVCQFPHYFWTIAERLAVLDGNVNLGSTKLCEIFSIEQRKVALIKQWS
jgi:Ser/Thr protein kinase RdoA (MazF antagonist)